MNIAKMHTKFDSALFLLEGKCLKYPCAHYSNHIHSLYYVFLLSSGSLCSYDPDTRDTKEKIRDGSLCPCGTSKSFITLKNLESPSKTT